MCSCAQQTHTFSIFRTRKSMYKFESESAINDLCFFSRQSKFLVLNKINIFY